MQTHVILTVYLGLGLALTLWRPVVAVGLLFTMYGVEQWVLSESWFFLHRPVLINVSFGLILGVGLIVRMLSGRPMLRPFTPVMGAVVALFSFALLSLVWSPERAEALIEMKSLLPALLAFVATPLLISDRKDLQAMFTTIVVGGVLVALLAILSGNWTARGLSFSGVSMTGRVSGNPLSFAELAGHVMIIAVLIPVATWRGSVFFPLRVAIGLLCLFVMIKTRSRGQLFGAVLATLVFVPISRPIRNYWTVIVGGVLTLLVVGLTYWAFIMFAEGERWEAESMAQALGESGRLYLIRQVLSDYLGSSPFQWVMGLGAYSWYTAGTGGQYPHNMIVEVTSSMGLVGLALLIVFYYHVARAGWSLVTLTRFHPTARGYAAILGAMTMLHLMLSMKQGHLFEHNMLFASAMILGKFQAICLQEAQVQYYQTLAAATQQPFDVPGGLSPA